MELSALEQYVVNTFGQIPTNKLPAEDFSEFKFRPDSVTPEFRNIYYIKPISDITEVSCIFLQLLTFFPDDWIVLCI